MARSQKRLQELITTFRAKVIISHTVISPGAKSGRLLSLQFRVPQRSKCIVQVTYLILLDL